MRVIVNGGLGPTVDDLSQEVAAQAAGVELALNEEWLARMEDFFNRRSRIMPPNNRKQAMLPTTAEVIDNPIGTACGFALDIGRARFFFTPGVPRELRRMLEEQVIPRILAKSGVQAVIHLKRFHSYGLGESHVDALLTGVEEMVPDGSVKLGFRAHYPQLETKLTMRGADMDDIRKKLAPVESEVRKRLGNFILAEDDQTLEGVVLAELASRQGTLAIAETFTSGQIAARIGPLSGAEKVFRRGVVSREVSELFAAVGLTGAPPRVSSPARRPRRWHTAVRRQSGATHALAVLVDLDEGADRIEFGGRSASRSRRRRELSRAGAASSAAASGCGSAPSRWGSIACAASSRGCPSTRGSISRRRRGGHAHAHASREGGGVPGAARAAGRLHHLESVGRGNGEAPRLPRLRGARHDEPRAVEQPRAARRGGRGEPGGGPGQLPAHRRRDRPARQRGPRERLCRTSPAPRPR
mgnify:CR=1 FL=1